MLRDELIDVLAFGLPQTKVIVGARCQRLEHWVEAQGLDRRIVRVLQQAYAFSRPDHDVSVSRAGCPSLAILGIGQAVDDTAMGTLGVNHLTRVRIVNHDTVTDSNQYLFAI